MEEDTNWSEETCTLETIAKYNLPCEIRMAEGIYDVDSEDTFSNEDIITIGDKQTIRKVSARFTKIVNEVTLATPDYDYVKLTGEDQILLPLNYKGLLKVLRHLRKFESVKDLADDFPKYARVCEGFQIRNEDNVNIPIPEGTIVELLRIITGSATDKGSELVVRHKYKKDVKTSSFPFAMRKKFEAIQDDDEYTIEDAIKRYGLPLLVRFNNGDEIKRVYGHGKTITDTLRLEEKITQGMLFGNFKIPYTADGEDTKGMPIVFPLTDPFVRRIEVYVRPGCTSDYEDVAFAHITDGSIYEDYATFSSKIKRLQTKSESDSAPVVPPRGKPISNVTTVQSASSRPTKPLPVVPEEQIQLPVKADMKHNKKHKKEKEQKKKKPPVKPKSPDNKTNPETPPSIPPRQFAQNTHKGIPLPPLPDQDISRAHGNPTYTNSPGRRQGPTVFRRHSSSGTDDVTKDSRPVHGSQWTPIGDELSGYVAMEGVDVNKSDYEKMNNKGVKSILRDYEKIIPPPVDKDDLNPYTELDLVATNTGTLETTPNIKNKNVVLQRQTKKETTKVTAEDSSGCPAEKSPSRQKPDVKHFLELNQVELVERLELCGLKDVAEICKEDSTIDGAFFKDMSTQLLKESFNLSGLRVAKLIQMRDSNWVPT